MIPVAEALSITADKIDMLDAELLLAHVLNVSRSFLFAWPDKILTQEQEYAFLQLVGRRSAGEPVPYITCRQAFWKLDFVVTKATLIPRPETETLVESVLNKFDDKKITLADLGTGCGAIALSLAHERPHWQVLATDISVAALEVAKTNALTYNLANVQFLAGHWCDILPAPVDVIVSNPPYIAMNDSHLKNVGLTHEPQSALVGGNDGLAALREIIDSAKDFLKPNGYLFLEHGYQQAIAVRNLLAQANYQNISAVKDLLGWERITIAQNN